MFKLISATLVILLLILGFSKGAENTKAQENTHNMRTMLEQLEEKMISDTDFQVAIRFVTPIIPDEDIVWVLPDHFTDDKDQMSRSISEIGDDYICFDVIGGAARFIECTPFSNIVSVRYLVQ